MADVEFADLGDGDDGMHIVIVEAMTCIHLQAQRIRVCNSVLDARQLVRLFRHTGGICIFPGVYFHNRRARCTRCIQLLLIRINKKRDAYSRFCTLGAGMFNLIEIAQHIQAAFGGELFAPFRNETHVVRLDAQCKSQHLVGDRALQIHAGLQHVAQDFHVSVLNVSAVFTQVQGDGIGPSRLAYQRRLQYIGVACAAHLAQRGYVVNIQA